jgi:hypothetical protein
LQTRWHLKHIHTLEELHHVQYHIRC